MSLASDRTWIGWSAVALGVCAAAAAFALSSTRVGEGFAFGFAAFIAFFGVLAILARHRRPDHWGLFVVGLATVTVPFLGNGYNADLGASWTCWVAGGIAMVLGAIGWLGDKAATGDRINELGVGQALRSVPSFWLGRAALLGGLATVVLGIAAHTTAAGRGVTIGLGVLAAVSAVWSLVAVDPTHDFLTLACTGFALFLSPWVAGFAGDDAGWTAWISGAGLTALGVAGYLRGERLDFAATVHDDAVARYRKRFR
ncbi:SPW repeat protein [Mycobacterium sp. UM_CSW]|uniref:SPW repeat domain-containing protein n=1 Tax=Mycobacterium sp. UM_CSW TaxID=1370119 RepID=UPI0003F774A2|nr:SPW repeat protein [Mycobacterium sp. UM_CSW]